MSPLIRGARIAGTGYAVPDRRVTSAELEASLGLETGWIARRTGIHERRWAAPGDSLSALAARAGSPALDRSGVSLNDVGLLILATSTPERLLPPTAPLVAGKLGLRRAGAVDMAGACAGFLYALAYADAYVRVQGRAALVIAANLLSRRIAPGDVASAVLFADAAGAVLLTPVDDPAIGIIGLELASDARGYDFVSIAAGGSERPFEATTDIADTRMSIAHGARLFSAAVDLMTECSLRALTAAHTDANAISRFIPHQANARIFDLVGKKLGFTSEMIVRAVSLYGNSSAATIPLALALSAEQNPLMTGERLLFAAAGAGLTGGAAVLKI